MAKVVFIFTISRFYNFFHVIICAYLSVIDILKIMRSEVHNLNLKRKLIKWVLFGELYLKL